MREIRATAIALLLLMASSSTTLAQTKPPTPLDLVDMAGAQHDVGDILDGGRNVVLVFWQTWCGPCKREAPGLAAAAREYADGLTFFGVISGTDRDVDDEKVKRYVAKYELPYAQIRDRDLALTQRYEVRATPTLIVLGAGHEVLYRGNHPPEHWESFVGPVVGH